MTRPSIVHPGTRRWQCWKCITCAACLGLNPRLISKIADDVHGKGMLKELQADGVDTSFLILTQTACSLISIGWIKLACHIIKCTLPVQATCRSIPIVIDVERKREGLDELLSFSTYVVCPANFPQVWTEASLLPKALLSMLLRLPNVKFVIVTLGENGCIMLERQAPEPEKLNVEKIMETLKQKIVHESTLPSYVSRGGEDDDNDDGDQ
ncbi:hypothetical protein Cgig2_012304 [Carnegiea gigantea]|uniref:Uncharacterized protein n=1 Tax=Carnegiea gigantea TaxID=171969 RepID=A0A9Q1QB21_9CARY|nr:hypothetical protein Cgig2_012304 [Carnegiea gigantea]